MTTGLRLGTRASRLAMAQAERAADALREHGHAIAIVPLSSAGDRDRRRSFAEFGGGGIFSSEIEQALRDGRIDVAVHSAKDLTGDEPSDLRIAACLARDDPRDAWVGPARSWEAVPQGARVATASLRRTSQLARLRPDLRVEPVRGNVDTRLRKRTERGLDAVVLAACGLDRLGLAAEIGFRVPVDEMVPEAGQGIIALQVRAGDDALVAAVGDPDAGAALRAERTVVRALDGGCSVPVAAHAERLGPRRWRLWAYAEHDGVGRIATREGDDPAALAATVIGDVR